MNINEVTNHINTLCSEWESEDGFNLFALLNTSQFIIAALENENKKLKYKIDVISQ